ncbi:uncharacterized protein [Littorina saxatilis]|uniref:uncharacterized protein isoform X2 n=1 Tax=Littorina saxatilis TaxID=31220 RepID=UPI0038B43D81
MINSAGAKFSFPTISPNLNVTVDENSDISLPFSLDTSKCTLQRTNVEIYVSQTPSHASEDVCIIQLMNGKCTSFLKEACRCRGEAEGGGIVFGRTMTREESGPWLWKTSDQSSTTEIFFDVQYSPRITYLSIIPDKIKDHTGNVVTVNDNTRVQVTCEWEKGHPASPKSNSVQLLDGSKQPLRNVQAHGEGVMRAEFRADCEDSGEITCFVPGATENRTVGLHVNCRSSKKGQTILRKTTSPSLKTLKVKETGSHTPAPRNHNHDTGEENNEGAEEKTPTDTSIVDNEDKDDEDGEPIVSNSGPILVVVNVAAFILVAIVVFVVLRRRCKNKEAQPTIYPAIGHHDDADDVMFVGRHPEPLVGEVGNGYELPGALIQRRYDNLPLGPRNSADGACETLDFEYINIRESLYGYEVVA